MGTLLEEWTKRALTVGNQALSRQLTHLTAVLSVKEISNGGNTHAEN